MRPVGQQIRAMLAASESLKRPASSTELARLAGIVGQTTLYTRVCRRAESYGLMDSIGIHRLQFIARSGWQQAIAKPADFKNPRIQPVVRKPLINSVWALGA